MKDATKAPMWLRVAAAMQVRRRVRLPRWRPAWGALVLALACQLASAGEADVVSAVVRPGAGSGRLSFDVTVRSRDRGWDYYAERFEVVGPDGTIIGTRVLLHPHDDEQPFTRELENVPIPAAIRTVTIRAWMKRGTQTRAAGGDVVTVNLPGR